MGRHKKTPAVAVAPAAPPPNGALRSTVATAEPPSEPPLRVLSMSFPAAEMNDSLPAYVEAGWSIQAIASGGYDSGGVWRELAYFTVVFQR